MRVKEKEKGNQIADLLVLSRPVKSLQNDAGFSGKLEHSGPVEKEKGDLGATK